MTDSLRRQAEERPRGGSAQVRKRILAASRRLLGRGGLEALTISAIAAEADVYSSAIFYHFGGKQGLWATLVRDLLTEANTQAQADLLAMPPGRERIRRAVESYDMIGGPEVQAAFFETLVPALRSGELRGCLARLYEDGQNKLADDLGAAEHPDQLEALRLVGQIVLAFTDGLNVQRLVDPEADFSPAVAVFQQMVVGALEPVLGLGEETPRASGNRIT